MSAVASPWQVDAGYRHIEKLITPAPGIDLAGARLKWYDIAPAGEPVPAPIRSLARTGLSEAAGRGAVAFPGQLGFVILHRCGASFYFLLIMTWRENNELWETVWAKDGESEPAFRAWPAEGPHRPTFCVWELGAVLHEQRAWSRYLYSGRDKEAVRAYLEDAYEGSV